MSNTDDIARHRQFGVALADAAMKVEPPEKDDAFDTWDSARRALSIDEWNVQDLSFWGDWPYVLDKTCQDGSEN